MIKRVISLTLMFSMLVSLASCSKKTDSANYPTENAGGTGYGAAIKSALYIEDFYFMTLGTLKSKIDLLIGSAHYCKDNNELMPVYTLNNGDSISVTFDEKKSTVSGATYTYSTGESENFFEMLVQLGVLRSSTQESGNDTTVVIPTPDTNDDTNDDTNENTTPDTQTPVVIPEQNTQTAIQGDVFASGMYNLTLIEAAIAVGMPRTSVVASVGKPNYYFSSTFAPDSYIIDCYNLTDGSKLYLDYGYARDSLRCAAVYKDGTYTSILSSAWKVQSKPEGFTRPVVASESIHSLSKNMTPAKVYKKLGEPSWYEGSRGSYSDVYLLSDGTYAYLNFGSAHNKLTSVSVKGENGSETVITIK